MKYKIKVEVMRDGSSKFYPMVKLNWWSRWIYLADIHKKFNFGCVLFVTELKDAQRIIQNFNRTLLDHTYEIQYKVEEE